MRKFDLKKIIRNTPNRTPLNYSVLENFEKFALEIGCGTGLHSINFAKKNPHTFIIAIEKTVERFGKFTKQNKLNCLTNILPVHAHAVSWVAHNFRQPLFDDIFILYPNPNPKPGDLNKRWYAMSFFDHLLNITLPGGRVIIRTNEKFYAEEAAHFFEYEWNLDCKTQPVKLTNIEDAKTLFEKKYLERGQTCYEIIGTKK